MQSLVKGQWPIMIFALMFFVLPFATIPGLFDFIFTVLGGFTFVIVGLVIASLIVSRMRSAPISDQVTASNGNGQ